MSTRTNQQTPTGTGMNTLGPVLIVGTGLLGTSLGLALSSGGVPVQLSDTSPTSLALAHDMGAGTPRDSSMAEPSIVIVATPPDVTGQVVLSSLEQFPQATVTDVASVKSRIGAQVLAQVPQHAQRYVGSHPMAGRERSGAGAADADLFIGRPWVLVTDHGTVQVDAEHALKIRNLAVDMGATPVLMTASEHDAAVAAVSHVPQLVSSLVAARLENLDASALALAGQGIRDVTRIAASDPRLWTAIIMGNAQPVSELLNLIREDLDTLIAGISPDTVVSDTVPGAAGTITSLMLRGNEGQARIPGKHGDAPRRYTQVQVLVPDTAGSLARLFADVGDAGINIEDLQLEHSAGQHVGMALLSVLPSVASTLESVLDVKGWRVVLS